MNAIASFFFFRHRVYEGSVVTFLRTIHPTRKNKESASLNAATMPSSSLSEPSQHSGAAEWRSSQDSNKWSIVNAFWPPSSNGHSALNVIIPSPIIDSVATRNSAWTAFSVSMNEGRWHRVCRVCAPEPFPAHPSPPEEIQDAEATKVTRHANDLPRSNEATRHAPLFTESETRLDERLTTFVVTFVNCLYGPPKPRDRLQLIGALELQTTSFYQSNSKRFPFHWNCFFLFYFFIYNGRIRRFWYVSNNSLVPLFIHIIIIGFVP